MTDNRDATLRRAHLDALCGVRSNGRVLSWRKWRNSALCAALALGLSMTAAACSGGSDGDDHGSGGDVASGGTDSGGSSATGGTESGGSTASGGATGGNDGTGGATGGSSAAGGSGTERCGTCPGGESCLVAEITRSDDTSAQPWVLWPEDADGQGTLMLSVSSDGEVVNASLAGVDLVPDGASFTIDLCLQPRTGTLMVFLDDDEDAESTASFSSDYLDSCAQDRWVQVTLTADTTLIVPYVLNNSCD